MLTPPYLKPGDSVGIVSTARKLQPNELEPALKILDNWGLKAVLGKTIGAESDQLAGDDDLRAADFQEMLDNPEIKAIWCARGGYGTVRIVDKLDFKAFCEKPKWIVGYSDITVFHAHINRCGIETLHAQMPLEIDKRSEETVNSIRTVLFGDAYGIEVEGTNKLNRPGTARAEVVGGNLSVLYSVCGSVSSQHTAGKILFLEDLDEYLYHIDRMMMNLKRNGMLSDLAGLIVGGMTDMNDNTIPFGKTAEEIVLSAVSEYNFPVSFNFPAGHVQDNRSLIMGREAELIVSSDKTTLDFMT